MVIIIPDSWNMDTLLWYMKAECPVTKTDSEGQVVLYTGLFAWSDGTLRHEPEGESELVARGLRVPKEAS